MNRAEIPYPYLCICADLQCGNTSTFIMFHPSHNPRASNWDDKDAEEIKALWQSQTRWCWIFLALCPAPSVTQRFNSFGCCRYSIYGLLISSQSPPKGGFCWTSYLNSPFSSVSLYPPFFFIAFATSRMHLLVDTLLQYSIRSTYMGLLYLVSRTA